MSLTPVQQIIFRSVIIAHELAKGVRTLSSRLLLVLLLLVGMAPSSKAEPAQKRIGSAESSSSGSATYSTFGSRILLELKPEQAAAYREGVAPQDLMLDSGESLDRLMARVLTEGSGHEGLVYYTLPTCVLARTVDSAAGALQPDGVRNLLARGEMNDLSAQGGSPTGCGIPASAAALLANFIVVAPSDSGELKIWPSDQPPGGSSLIRFSPSTIGIQFDNAAPVALCSSETCPSDFRVQSRFATTHLRIDVMGYFAPATGRNTLDAADGDPASAVYVDSVGRMGIGTTAPTRPLEISGDAFIDGELRISSLSGAPESKMVVVDAQGDLSAQDILDPQDVVTSLNGLQGNVGLQAGSSIELQQSGATITISGTQSSNGGITEISQGSVLSSGGFPAVLTEPGSYRLTSNLLVPDENTTAIEIIADNITIDLNGFSILGPVDCSGLACNVTGSGFGVNGAANRYLTVTNGTIRGMGRDGIGLGQDSRVEGVLVSDNGDDGITLGGAGIVYRCIVKNNGGRGVKTAILKDSVVSSNFGAGVEISGNNGVISGNQILFNNGDGITNRANPSNGGSLIVLNAVYANGGFGLDLSNESSVSAFGNNNFNSNNAGGAQTQGGIEISTNICEGNTTCP